MIKGTKKVRLVICFANIMVEKLVKDVREVSNALQQASNEQKLGKVGLKRFIFFIGQQNAMRIGDATEDVLFDKIHKYNMDTVFCYYSVDPVLNQQKIVTSITRTTTKMPSQEAPFFPTKMVDSKSQINIEGFKKDKIKVNIEPELNFNKVVTKVLKESSPKYNGIKIIGKPMRQNNFFEHQEEGKKEQGWRKLVEKQHELKQEGKVKNNINILAVRPKTALK